MFESAIALDPRYAGAYDFLGWTYLGRVGSGNGVRTRRLWRRRLPWRNRRSSWMTLYLGPHDAGVAYLWQKQHERRLLKASGRLPLIPTMLMVMRGSDTFSTVRGELGGNPCGSGAGAAPESLMTPASPYSR